MALADGVRNLLARVEQQGARLLLIALGVMILLRLRLILFAAALPLMAYWHYSNQEEAGEEPIDSGEAEDGAGAASPPADAADLGGDVPWPADDDEDDMFAAPRATQTGGDPYDQSFWCDPGPNAAASKRSAPWRSTSATASAPRDGHHGAGASGGTGDTVRSDLEEDLGLEPLKGGPKPKDLGGLDHWDTGGDLDDMFLDDAVPAAGGGRGGGGGAASAGAARPTYGDDVEHLGGFGGPSSSGASGAKQGAGGHAPGGGGLEDFDFLGNGLDLLGGGMGGHNGLDDDMDFLGGGFGGFGGRGKGKGKGKKGDKGDKGERRDPNAPRDPDPKQVFVANVGDLAEEEIRGYFEEVGEVDRLKVLRNPDGGSKGVCFVTFATVDQAQKALGLHGSQLEGRSLVVRLAHGGNKGLEKGGVKGGFFAGGDRDRDHRDRDRAGGMKGSSGRGKGQGGLRRNDRGEMDELLEEALAEGEGPLKPADFDFAARRFLAELRSCDRADGTQRFQEALEMVLKYTNSKDRASVRKWPAYVFTLLQKFDPGLWEDLRERDAERRREKGGGGFATAREPRGPCDD